MIPWTAFGSTESDPDWRIELNEFNLNHYVKRGPSQFTRGIESSMLEQAFERRFAMSQLGSVCSGFELEHTLRVDLAVQTLLGHFVNHPNAEPPERPSSPYQEDLGDFRSSQTVGTFEPLPPLELDLDQHPSPTFPPAATERSSRSPLAILDMMNPEPQYPSPGKRKHPGSRERSVVDVDMSDHTFDVDNESLYKSTLDYVRTPHSHIPKLARTHREARMRRPSPSRVALRLHRLQKAHETEEAEKEAHLLLSLSRKYAELVS